MDTRRAVCCILTTFSTFSDNFFKVVEDYKLTLQDRGKEEGNDVQVEDSWQPIEVRSKSSPAQTFDSVLSERGSESRPDTLGSRTEKESPILDFPKEEEKSQPQQITQHQEPEEYKIPESLEIPQNKPIQSRHSEPTRMKEPVIEQDSGSIEAEKLRTSIKSSVDEDFYYKERKCMKCGSTMISTAPSLEILVSG